MNDPNTAEIWQTAFGKDLHVHVYCRLNNVKTTVEQRLQHRGGTIHVLGPKKLVSDGSIRLLRIHENTAGVIPRIDQKTVQFGHSRTGWICVLGNKASCEGTPTGRHFG